MPIKRRLQNIVLLRLIILLLILPVAIAQAATDVKFNRDSPVNIEANILYYNKLTNIVYAKGNVEIYQENQIILSDEAQFDRNTNQIYAKGNISALKDDGSLYFGDEARFDKDTFVGVILNFKARMSAQGALAAKYADIESKEVYSLDHFVYSPCSICNDNYFANTPLWQLRADHATLNKNDETIKYYDARVEVLDTPIFYTPYFQTPAPGAKRKSGFLIPELRSSRHFGKSLRIPFYWNIRKDMDATIGVQVNEKKDPVYDLEFRKRFNNGESYSYILGINDDKLSKQGKQLHGKEWRLYANLENKFTFADQKYLPGTLRLSSKILVDKPRTFHQVYGIDKSVPIFLSEAKYTSYAYNYFTRLSATHFRDLRSTSSLKTTAQILPGFYSEYYYDLGYGFTLLNYTDYSNLAKSEGSSYQRLSDHITITKSNLFYGIEITNEAKFKADLYNTRFRNFGAIQKPNSLKTGGESRFFPELSSKLSYPMINYIAGNSIILSPTAQVILAPNTRALRKVQNEDAEEPQISYSNLFSDNRFYGFDRIETGQRLNYGLSGSIKNDLFDNFSFLFGQVIRMRKENFALEEDSLITSGGLEGKRSDYISKISLNPNKGIYINNATRYNKDNFSPERNELWLDYSDEKLNIQILHDYINPNILKNKNQFRQEMYFLTQYNFYKHWWFTGDLRTKLGKNRANFISPLLNGGLGLRYMDECFKFETHVTRNFQVNKDVTRSTTFIVKLDVPVF